MTVSTGPVGRRVAGWTALAAGLGALATALVLGIHSLRPPGPVGVLPAAAPSPVQLPSAGASPAKPALTSEGVPTRLSIAALRMNAPVQAVGVGPDRALRIPSDPGQLGWWIGSAMPGSAKGTVLIVGHVDTAREGPGALFKLEHLRMGSRIEVRIGDRTVAYRAVARRSYPKQKLPQQLFSTGAPAELALVTCGGTFRHGTYSDNVVVYGQPTS
jgi:hypothetical protein